MHQINITDNTNNWLAWGNLVLAWVNGTQATPQTVHDLRTHMTAAHVQGHIHGNPNQFQCKDVMLFLSPACPAIIDDKGLARHVT